MELIVGVDIGQKRSPTGICVAIASERREGQKLVRHFTVPSMEQLSPGTSYPSIADRLLVIIFGSWARTGLSPRVYVHATGIGQPVIDLLRERYPSISPVYLNFGDRKTKESGQITIGKAWLVSRIQVLLQTGRLHLPRSSEAETLVEELLAFEIDLPPDANDRMGAFPVGTRDDLVTALGLAVQSDAPSIVTFVGSIWSTQ